MAEKIVIINQNLHSVKPYKYITVFFTHSLSNHQERDSVPKNENCHQLLTLMLLHLWNTMKILIKPERFLLLY